VGRRTAPRCGRGATTEAIIRITALQLELPLAEIYAGHDGLN
jgi:hypothetical protein